MTEYRDVTNDDVGKIVETSTAAPNGEPMAWMAGELIAILPPDLEDRYIVRHANKDFNYRHFSNRYARIAVEEEFESRYMQSLAEYDPSDPNDADYRKALRIALRDMEKRIWELERR